MFLESDVIAIQDICGSLTRISECYGQLLELIDSEHQAISKSYLKEIESLVAEKVSIGDRIMTLGDELIKNYESLVSKMRTREIIPNTKLSIKDFLKFLLNKQKSLFNQKDMICSVLLHELKKLDAIYSKLEELKNVCNPKIEMNQYLVRRLLYHHQETFRFWQNIAIESAATYGSRGIANKQDSNATLVIRT